MNMEPLSAIYLSFPAPPLVVDGREQAEPKERYAGLRFARCMIVGVGLCTPFWVLAILGLRHLLCR